MTEQSEKKAGNLSKTSKIDGGAVRELASLLNETGLTEIELEQDGLRLRVAKSVAASVVAAPAPAAAAPAAAPAAAAAPAPSAEGADHPGAVTSPMVGTVYVAPEPGAKAFVSVGDSVTEGQTLLIVEAMKTMNQIPAPRAGKITSILVSNGQPVEYGEPLVVIE